MPLKAAIFDTDGVITDTARQHFKAWKQVFDTFLKEYSKINSITFQAFTEKDYFNFVDGIGRLNGTYNFLKSRGINLAISSKNPDEESVYSLAERKTKLFLEIMRMEGVTVFKSTIDLIKALKNEEIKIAAVSASKNCKEVLQKAKIIDLFDTIVDGVEAERLNLKTKPDPGIFLAAAEKLNAKAAEALVVEDAILGVKAGKQGHFGLVIGIDRTGSKKTEFESLGADIVLNDLSLVGTPEIKKFFENNISNALSNFNTIQTLMKGQDLIFFSDFDGTLTPIVDRPELALISSAMRQVLLELNRKCPVVIISGRKLEDVMNRIDIEGLYYAGNHGFEIIGPKKFKIKLEKGSEYKQGVKDAYEYFTQTLSSIKGCFIENKDYSLSIHYRLVEPEKIPFIQETIKDWLKAHPALKQHAGKKVFEIRPNLEWNKGKALRYILEKIRKKKKNKKLMPIYMGDDSTDEDAFFEVKKEGVGILVGKPSDKTQASYLLEDTQEVYSFIKQLVKLLNARELAPTVLEKKWHWRYYNFSPEHELLREALCTLGNGYFATRGAHEEAIRDTVHYPGTYCLGIYNQLTSKVDGREIVSEDLVNMPNWLSLYFKHEDVASRWFNLLEVEILDYYQELDLKQGILKRKMLFKDKDRITEIASLRYVSMNDRHVAALQFVITPQNWSGKCIIRSGIDGSVTNSGVKRYQTLRSKHLENIQSGSKENTIYLLAHTSQSQHTILEIVKHILSVNNKVLAIKPKYIKYEESIFEEFECFAEEKQSISIEKLVYLATSKDKGIMSCFLDGFDQSKLFFERGFYALFKNHQLAWQYLWDLSDITIRSLSHDQKIVRLHIFHLLQTISKNSIGLDAGIPARGLHGEAYRGHIFWDELFVLPFYIFHFPDTARDILLYRYYRLPMARSLAKKAGCKGAMFPWQSASNGDEVSQKLHVNPLNNQWIDDYSYYQRHINAAIVYNIWQYYQVTHDMDFMIEYGAEMLLDIARFWSSITFYNHEISQYEIDKVLGPDEYHEKYPWLESPGLRNNAYTNVMCVWSLERALEVLKLLPKAKRDQLMESLALSEEELNRWRHITRRMKIPFHSKEIISQFEGYEKLQEFDWEVYSKQYGNIERLDRILKSKGDSPDNYKLSKQADVLMLFYLFTCGELKLLFKKLGYFFNKRMLKKNIEYYAKRTSHGSSLSKVVFASVSSLINLDMAANFYYDALRVDITDAQGGTTQEGIHLGAMAASLQIIYQRFAGLLIKKNRLSFSPRLPDKYSLIKFKLKFRSLLYAIKIKKESFEIKLEGKSIKSIVYICNVPYEVSSEKASVVLLN